MIHEHSIEAIHEERATGATSRRCVEILGALAAGYKTDREIAEALGYLARGAVAPRITEMINQGILEERESTIDTVTRKRVRTIAVVDRKRKPEQLEFGI